MASSVVHLAITNELTKSINFNDTNRLKFGSVLVDAGSYGKSHLKVNVSDGKKKCYDFDRYRQMFGERMLADDLYLGYYLHLVQDALYRHYVYDRYHWNPMIPGNVERLHRDYSIVNHHVVTKYRLENDLVIPEDFENEDINQIDSFDTSKLMADMCSYFVPVAEEPIFFFTKEMSDEYITEALAFCIKEVENLRNGLPGIDMLAYAWERGVAQAKE
ncbi:MAG: hypothetical protein K6E50_04980 [Lachnospiraceae bacterium]|nr:hypothetical protein [Lachnospiraceae bacterium]